VILRNGYHLLPVPSFFSNVVASDVLYSTTMGFKMGKGKQCIASGYGQALANSIISILKTCIDVAVVVKMPLLYVDHTTSLRSPKSRRAERRVSSRFHVP
jgi:hypothetical protein